MTGSNKVFLSVEKARDSEAGKCMRGHHSYDQFKSYISAIINKQTTITLNLRSWKFRIAQPVEDK